MNADQKKRIAHEISNWKNACNCRAVQLTGDRMAALLQELADGYDAPEALAATNPSKISSSAEPFGYFKAEPFGWTDCAETDDGAIALFDAPPAPIYNAPAYMATHDAWRGLEPFLGKDVPDSEVVLLSDVKAMLTTPPAPIVPDGWRYVIPGRRRTEKSDSSRVGDYNQGWNDCRGITEKALNDLEKRK